jgi:hypothetical protein
VEERAVIEMPATTIMVADGAVATIDGRGSLNIDFEKAVKTMWVY